MVLVVKNQEEYNMKTVKKYKLSRRLQVPIFEKCQTQKFALREQRRTKKRSRRMPSEYKKQLIEKQKVRFLYGISEKVMKNYINKSIERAGITEDNLVQLLERRVDNLVYRLGLAETRRMARQNVSHGHITINGRKITIPSYQIKDTDIIEVREGSKNTVLFKSVLGSKVNPRVNWVKWSDGRGSVIDTPKTDDGIFRLSSVLEYYSR